MKPPSSQIVLVRHGETAWSRSGQHTGRTDIPLLEEGKRMGAALSAPLKAWRFDAVWTSPLSRARETCALAGYGGAAKLRPELMEWDYGAYEGKTAVEIRSQLPDWTLWRDGVPQGETADQVRARVDPLIAEARQAGGHVLLFSHGHLLRVFAARWLDLPLTDGRLFTLGTASISVLGWDGNQPVLVSWNDTTHLRE
ncbi:histidine phosphatase family protein [Stigmatella aurantiaca]|uniref:EntD n=1 Tax=Stigmatella aurantiaca (strain DW4/3-1) TaxID=378806 RepID=Q08XQ0_STIAD|nr:histidine phosphatase family protein [Stigmatella aurantiaca]ADO75383.1 Phosphoglycerate mutase family protein [Stigmatella aurantiaca DW4/3-1]EAU65238.1 EntD [Stigmatella aurantiaca DW4/3-1]